MGQPCGGYSGGTQGVRGQTIGQKPIPGRRGWKGAIVVALGPLRWSEHHHKVVVVSGGAAETEQTSALQVTLGTCGAHKKNHKNKRRGEI